MFDYSWPFPYGTYELLYSTPQYMLNTLAFTDTISDVVEVTSVCLLQNFNVTKI